MLAREWKEKQGTGTPDPNAVAWEDSARSGLCGPLFFQAAFIWQAFTRVTGQLGTAMVSTHAYIAWAVVLVPQWDFAVHLHHSLGLPCSSLSLTRTPSLEPSASVKLLRRLSADLGQDP